MTESAKVRTSPWWRVGGEAPSASRSSCSWENRHRQPRRIEKDMMGDEAGISGSMWGGSGRTRKREKTTNRNLCRTAAQNLLKSARNCEILPVIVLHLLVKPLLRSSVFVRRKKRKSEGFRVGTTDPLVSKPDL